MEALHPLIQEVLNGKSADSAVDDRLSVKDYADSGFLASLSAILRTKTVAILNIQQKAVRTDSQLRLDCMARGKNYSISAKFYDGQLIDGQVKCESTGYRRGIPQTGWELLVLRTLLGNDCMRGPNGLKFISSLPPDTEIPTDMLGVPWVRYDGGDVLYAERGTVPVSALFLKEKSLNAGELFKRACALYEGVEFLPPKVQAMKKWGDEQDRFVVVQGGYDVVLAHWMGRDEVEVIIQRTAKETEHGQDEKSPDPGLSGLRESEEDQSVQETGSRLDGGREDEETGRGDREESGHQSPGEPYQGQEGEGVGA